MSKVQIIFLKSHQLEVGEVGPKFEDADVNFNDAGTAVQVFAKSKEDPSKDVCYIYPLHIIARVKVED